MVNKKENILLQLKSISDNLGHSIKRRDCPYSLYADCVKYFGSFNKAKKLAGLKIVNVRITQFPDNAFRIDKDLAKISAYLTADGHLYKNLKGFQFYSNNKEKLKEFEEIIYQKFKLKGKYGEGTGYGKTFRYTIFNSSISKFLNKLGVPSGNKMFISFDIPEWIKNNKEFSREYLKVLFYCEGSKYKHSKNTYQIKINFNKSEKLLDDGIKFMNSIQESLKMFNIYATNIWISKGNIRKDGEITKQINFKLKAASNDKFIKEIGWLK